MARTNGREYSDFFKDVNDSNSLKSYQDYLPSDQNQFKIIITTRIKNSSNQFKELSLPELSEDAALELLESFIGKLRLVNELEQAKAICKWLGYLPLGLTLVGQYLVESEYLSLIQMQEKLEKKRLNYDFLTPDDETQRRIKKIFDLSWEELNNKVQKVTYFLSLFAVAPILGSLIEKILPENGEDDWQNILDKILVKRSLLQLQGKEIITNKISKGIYQLHPILREFIYLKLEEYPQKDNIKKEFCCAIVTDIKKQPETLNQKVIDKMKIIYYIPHISEVAISLKTFLKPEDLAIPFISLGRFYCYQGDYGKAMYFARQHLLTSRQVLGKEHINLADAINHLGLIYYHQGDYKKAKARFEKALKIRKKILGEDSLDVADSLDNLAMVYCQIKCYNEAKNLLKQVLKIRKNILGEIHSDIVTNLNNLAGVYYEWGTELELSGYNFDEQRNFGKYLTYCIQARNCYLEAKSLFQEALEISKKVFPSKHSDRASILNNLAGIYRKLGEYNEAESNYVQALTMQIELLGKEHQDVGHSINNLAVLYASQEYYQNAKFLIKQALEIFEKSLGIEHIYTVKIRQNFEEICLEKLGKKLPENKKNKFAEICKLIEFEPDIDSKNN
jgi:tetratricopeptide (TPR) repeat protein